MSDGVGSQIAAGIAAIIGLAVLGVVVSNSANTVNVVSAFFGGVSNLIAVAISPITGATVQGNVSGQSGGSWANGSSSGSGGILGGLLGGGSGFAVNPGSLLGGGMGGLTSGVNVGQIASIAGMFA